MFQCAEESLAPGVQALVQAFSSPQFPFHDNWLKVCMLQLMPCLALHFSCMSILLCEV